MSLRLVTMLLLIGAAALCGCRTHPHVASFIENRNAEARLQEDEYWRQVQENERLAYELAKLKRQKERAKEQPPAELGPPKVDEGLGLPMMEGADMPSEAPPEQKMPRIEPEAPPRPDGSVDPSGSPPGDLPPPRGAAPAKPTQPEEIDQKVTHLFLNPLHTGGVDLDRRPGDDGVSLLLEPRNAADQYVPLAGNVSVVLLDPQKSGDAARLARWNFGSRDVQQALAAEGESRGIRLEMPWPARPPESDQLKLFVRYEMADGRKVQTERDIFVRLPGQVSERWTPRPPERQRRNPPVESPIVRQTEPAAKESSSAVASQPNLAPPPAAGSSAPLLSPPPALGEAPGKSAPSRPTWKPYR